jgi:hypothetical protein
MRWTGKVIDASALLECKSKNMNPHNDSAVQMRHRAGRTSPHRLKMGHYWTRCKWALLVAVVTTAFDEEGRDWTHSYIPRKTNSFEG